MRRSPSRQSSDEALLPRADVAGCRSTRPDRPPSRGILPLHLRLQVARIDSIMTSLFRKSTLARAAALLAIVLTGGCSSGLSKNECLIADWHMIGYEDGLHGFPADRIGVHRVACAKFQVTPNLAAYTEGRERGLVEFCQPRNGFRVGLNGWSYANVCSAASEPAFVEGYRYGREIHDARAELRDTQVRLRRARDGLAQSDAAVQAIAVELVLPDVPTSRRVFLAQELVRLTEERTELQARINRLTLRSRELGVSVAALERQSPFAL